MLYSELLDLWIEEKKLEVRGSTIQNYMYCTKKWIVPALGDIQIENITRKILQDFITEFAKHHKRNTVINLSKPLSGSLGWAEEQNLITSSPWKDIKFPKDFSEKEIKIFSQEEIEKLLKARGYKQVKKDMIILGYRTGMRIGEVLALKWEDVNFDEGFLMVKRTLSGYRDNRPEIAEPKTRSSRRRIDLDEKTLDMLHRRYKEQETYVFSKNDGSIYSRQAMNLPRMCRNVGIPPRSFHALRHTHATILLSSKIHPKIVQERLGHSKVLTTLDTYSHLIPGMQQAVVDVFNKI